MKRPKRDESTRTKEQMMRIKNGDKGGGGVDGDRQKNDQGPKGTPESNRVKKVPKTVTARRESSVPRDSTTSSSAISSPSSTSASAALRRPCGFHPDHTTLPLPAAAALPLHPSATPLSASADHLLFPALQLCSPLGASASSSASSSAPFASLHYGPFGIPQLFHPPPAPQISGIDKLFHLPPSAVSGASALPPLFPAASVSQNAFEGLPIFVVPPQGTLLPNALQRAQEFKTMALKALLQHQQQQQPQKSPRIDTSKHYHIFVGDLSQEVDNAMLKQAFDKFGYVSEAKVMRDSQSAKSRSYGFVAFPDKSDAQRAIEGMHGVLLGRRPVRTGWAVRRSSIAGSGGGGAQQQNGSEDETGNQQQRPATASYESVYNATDADNTTIYLGGLPNTTTEEPIRAAFSAFGTVREVRLFASQNFGFVVFADKPAAARAIVEMHGRELDLGVVAGGCVLRVKWGRQPQDKNNATTAPGGNNTDQQQTVIGSGMVNGIGANGGNNNMFPPPAMVAISQHQQQQQQHSAAALIAAAHLAQQQQQLALSTAALVQQYQQQQQHNPGNNTQLPMMIPYGQQQQQSQQQFVVPSYSAPGGGTSFLWVSNQ